VAVQPKSKKKKEGGKTGGGGKGGKGKTVSVPKKKERANISTRDFCFLKRGGEKEKRGTLARL